MLPITMLAQNDSINVGETYIALNNNSILKKGKVYIVVDKYKSWGKEYFTIRRVDKKLTNPIRVENFINNTQFANSKDENAKIIAHVLSGRKSNNAANWLSGVGIAAVTAGAVTGVAPLAIGGGVLTGIGWIVSRVAASQNSKAIDYLLEKELKTTD